jgi:DNA-binding NarL/FixJ family response regulator
MFEFTEKDPVSLRSRRCLGELTPRQFEVLELMASGLSNAAIARRLWISERTLSGHVRAILTTLMLAPDCELDRRVAAVIVFRDAYTTEVAA